MPLSFGRNRGTFTTNLPCAAIFRGRRRALQCVLWVAPCFLLAVITVCTLFAWIPLSMSGEPEGLVLNLRAANLSSSNSSLSPPSLVIIPAEMPPFVSPEELEEYLTGPEIMALRVSSANHTAVVLGINDTETVAVENLHGNYPMSCDEVDMGKLAYGFTCGTPLSMPCFDHSRCRPPPAGRGPTVYVYDEECSLENSSNLPPSNESLQLSYTWREAAREAGTLSESYEDACIFLHVNKKINVDPCAAETPLWNGGLNHVMVDLTDNTRDRRAAVAESLAMDAAANIRTCYYRSGYDFAIPLRHKWDMRNTTHFLPWQREYFLTVKGNLYLTGPGYDERLPLVALHNEPEGVVIALNCFEMHDEHLLPQNLEFCDALNNTAGRFFYEYDRLLNSTFGLVPAGRSPSTYRLAEVMGAGAIPVFVARDYVRPFPERVDWPSFSFMFPPEEVGLSMMDTLQAVSPAELWKMQRKSVAAFMDIFGEEPGYSRIAHVVLEELVKRIGFHG